MTLKIKCVSVAEYEPFTIGKVYSIISEDSGVFYIKDDDGKKTKYFKTADKKIVDGIIEALGKEYNSSFSLYTVLEQRQLDLKTQEKVHLLLEKVTELVYNNQELFNIKLDDFITLVKLTEDTK